MTFAHLHRWCMVAGLALAIVVAPLASFANGSILYRADSRAPEVIFREGFVGRGPNLNVLHHLSGMSCWEPEPGIDRSAYVSMADEPDEALVYATYVYRIRPDADAPEDTAAYSAGDGMRVVQRDWQALGLDLRQRTDIEDLMRMPWVDGQYLSRRIPPEWIQAAMVYTIDPNGAPVYQRMIVNPGYRPPARMGGRTTFSRAMLDGIRGHVPVQSHTRYVVAPNATAVAACMDSDNACGGAGTKAIREPLRASNGTRALQCATQPLLRPGNRMQRAVDIILSP